MKKLLLLNVALLGILTSCNKDIEMYTDDTISENSSFIYTEQEVNISEGSLDLCGLSLSRHIYNNEKIWWSLSLQLIYNDNLSIDKDKLLLIKLNDDSIIELKTDYKAEKNDNYTKELPLGILGIIGITKKVHIIQPFYDLPEELLDKIINIGVEKIRIELDYGCEDIYQGKTFTKFIDESYKMIQTQSMNDVYRGF